MKPPIVFRPERPPSLEKLRFRLDELRPLFAKHGIAITTRDLLKAREISRMGQRRFRAKKAEP